MKKLTFFWLMSALMLTAIPMQSKANTEPKLDTTASVNPAESEQARVLISRLDEIKDMDKSDMNWGEKKQLRQEVRSIRSQLRDLGAGIYISVGGAILIVLLLILLL